MPEHRDLNGAFFTLALFAILLGWVQTDPTTEQGWLGTAPTPKASVQGPEPAASSLDALDLNDWAQKRGIRGIWSKDVTTGPRMDNRTPIGLPASTMILVGPLGRLLEFDRRKVIDDTHANTSWRKFEVPDLPSSTRSLILEWYLYNDQVVTIHFGEEVEGGGVVTTKSVRVKSSATILVPIQGEWTGSLYYRWDRQPAIVNSRFYVVGCVYMEGEP